MHIYTIHTFCFVRRGCGRGRSAAAVSRGAFSLPHRVRALRAFECIAAAAAKAWQFFPLTPCFLPLFVFHGAVVGSLIVETLSCGIEGYAFGNWKECSWWGGERFFFFVVVGKLEGPVWSFETKMIQRNWHWHFEVDIVMK